METTQMLGNQEITGPFMGYQHDGKLQCCSGCQVRRKCNYEITPSEEKQTAPGSTLCSRHPEASIHERKLGDCPM